MSSEDKIRQQETGNTPGSEQAVVAKREKPSILSIDSSKFNPKNKRVRPKILAILALVVLAAVVGGLLVWQPKQPEGDPQSDQPKADQVAEFYNDAGAAAVRAGDVAANGDFQEAVDILNEYLESDPEVDSRSKAHVLSVKAAYLVQLGSFNEAVEIIKQAIEAAPDDPRYYYFAGNYHRYIGEDERALEYYKKAVEEYDNGLPEGYQGQDREFFAQYAEGGF